jgi:phage anti-repressor protein
MLTIIEKDNTKYVQLTELYEKLELDKTDYSKFIKDQFINNEYANEGKEFSYLGTKTTSKGGRPKADYLLTLDFAKDIIIRTKSKVGKQYRDWLLSLEKKVENNKLLTIEKTALVVQMINTFKFGEYQIEAEKLHKDTFMLSTITKENIHKLFGQYRNELLDINNYELKQGLIDAYQKGLINTPKGKNIRTRLFHLDKYVLVRNAVADYLLSIGVNTHDALTFADSVKMVAELTNLEIKIKNEDTLFQHKENVAAPIELSKEEIITKLLN